ncbi:MAG: peptidoglycan DD-metalloendopeptidase family protein [candidate division KSB1 bacterium]|nr:peptidoglycan DD-metalloendopeptidase family protein [candidate division KSB1 bacterium]
MRRGPQGKVLIALSPSAAVSLYGLPEALGSDDFVVTSPAVYKHDSLRYELSGRLGSGIYLGDDGWLGNVTWPLRPDCASVRLYDPQGHQKWSAQLGPLRAAAISAYGGVFAAAGLRQTLVCEGKTGRSFVLPSAEAVTVANDGTVALLRGSRAELWREGQLSLVADLSPARIVDALWVPGWGQALLLSRHRLLALDGRGAVLWEREAKSGEVFRDLEVEGDSILVGLSLVQGPARQGVLRILDRAGYLLGETRSSEQVRRPGPPPVGKRLRPGRDPVPWPFAPFDRPRPIGNTYEEYQNYGGSPYLHPGVDILAPYFEPVFAVSDGVVKAVLTISGEYHWRIAVGETASEDTTEGWLYAHLVRESIPFSVGDTVRAGDYLGQIVPWPVAEFHHLHFVKVRQGGMSWSPDWEAVFNPLEVLRPLADSTGPVFEPIESTDARGSPFAYVRNGSGEQLNPDSLSGAVDIVIRVGDKVGSEAWLCSVYELRHWVESLQQSRIVWGPIGLRLSHRIPHYTGTPEMARVLYSDRDGLVSRGNYDERVFYHIVTNCDGDSLLEIADAEWALPCDLLPEGPYRVVVEARDASGNSRAVADTFWVRKPTGLGATETPAGPPMPIRLQIIPNPARKRVRIAWTSTLRGPAQLQLFDIRGRLVQQRVLASGSGEYVWDGTDGSGRRLPTGLYLCRVRVGGSESLARLLWID